MSVYAIALNSTKILGVFSLQHCKQRPDWLYRLLKLLKTFEKFTLAKLNTISDAKTLEFPLARSFGSHLCSVSTQTSLGQVDFNPVYVNNSRCAHSKYSMQIHVSKANWSGQGASFCFSSIYILL